MIVRSIAIAALLAPFASAAQQAPTAAPSPAPGPTPAASTPAASTPATGVANIYATALGDGWQNWSWAKTELSVELNGSARRPIRVEAGPYQALYLHHAPFDTTPYKSIHLLLNGGATGGQQVRIVTVVGGKPLDTQAHAVKLDTPGWKRVELPLARIGADAKTIDGFWVQNGTDQPAPAFYAAEIALR